MTLASLLLLCCRARHKPKIDILLVKSAEFDDIIAAESQPLPDLDAPSSSASAAQLQYNEQSRAEQSNTSSVQHELGQGSAATQSATRS